MIIKYLKLYYVKIYDDLNVYENQKSYTGSHQEIRNIYLLEKNAYLILCKSVL